MVSATQTAPAASSVPTCSQRQSFKDGICQTKAAAGWGNASKVSATRPVCPFAELYPF